MSLDICTLSALSAMSLHDRVIPHADLTALIVTDTDDRSSSWAFKFAENMGLKYVGWNWDRKLSVWDLVLTQVGQGNAKPMAEVHLMFANGDFGYILSLIEYRPLFWMGAGKFGPEISKRHPATEAVYTADNGREIAAVVKKLSFACKDDIDPTDRLVRLLNELGRTYNFKFNAVRKDEVEIEVEGMELYNDYLKGLAVFGYETKMFSGPTPTSRKMIVESPKLKTGK